jgi:hypothetical protein
VRSVRGLGCPCVRGIRFAFHPNAVGHRGTVRAGVVPAVTVMARVALVLFLTLLNAAGPSLWCCTAGRFLGRCLLREAGRGFCSSHCCGRHGENGGQSQAPDGRHPHDPCPCQEPQPVASEIETSTAFANHETRAPAASFPCESNASVLISAVPNSATAGHVPPRPGALPGLDCRTILASLHILRC